MTSQSNFAGNVTVTKEMSDAKLCALSAWLIDSGASDHFTGNKEIMSNVRTLRKEIRVGLPDGSVKTVNEVGNVKISPNVTLTGVLYVNDFKHNLLSVSKLLESRNLRLLFDNQRKL